ncbi:MAG TPA: response regulator [Chitinophagaceae bacterium]|jgi:CheY-like chemotaxis protein|nr:response regulator [Chitinophagaceae bacterium]
MPQPQVLHILLVDDDATDRELFREASASWADACVVREAAHGEEALQMLGEGTRLPDLILLDLNMPVKDGRETLRDIKAQEAYRAIPVCILSTSSAHFDVDSAYRAGASLFLVKPFDFKSLTEMVQNLHVLFSRYVARA